MARRLKWNEDIGWVEVALLIVVVLGFVVLLYQRPADFTKLTPEELQKQHARQRNGSATAAPLKQ